ncbi:MAG TPA: tol-pal system protein YbgF [Stellaceae bacterium]|nr:tol-pal system protein YbgF [Stellaceae bacterium]
MIRPLSLPPRACPILMLAFVAFATVPAWAQDASTQERLDRLERDLSMLQRQIYGGSGAGGGGFPASGNIAVNTQVRMDRLEQEMRDLTGKVENATNQVEQLRQRLEQVNSDIDVRFGQLGQASGQGMATPPPAPQPSRHARAFAPPAPEAPAIDRPPPPVGPPPSPYTADGGTLTPPPLSPPPPPDAFAHTPPDMPSEPTRLTPSRTNVAAAGGSLRPPAAGNLPRGSAFDQYNAAFGLVRQANYPAAEDALRNFVAEHPNHALAGNAQYWLGEVYLKRGRYGDAAAAFAEGYKRYPKGAKAPEQLLGLASALGHENQKQNACVALSQLDHDFPHPGSAVKERSAAEKKRLGC